MHIPKVQLDFQSQVFGFLETQEPTLFYVIRQKYSHSQLKSSLMNTIQVLLEFSDIPN